jgi:hypothetical protein
MLLAKKPNSKRSARQLQHASKPSRSKSRPVKSRKKKRNGGRRQLRQKPNRKKRGLLLNVPRLKLPKLGRESCRDNWRLLTMNLRAMRRDLKKPRPRRQHLP